MSLLPEGHSINGGFSWSQLLRAIAAALPADAEVQFFTPGPLASAICREHGRSSDVGCTLPNSPSLLADLAGLSQSRPDERICVHLFVYEARGACLLEAWDLDFGIETIFLRGDVSAQTARRFEEALHVPDA